MLLVVFEVPQLKPDDNRATIAACDEAIMQMPLKIASFILEFLLSFEKGVPPQADLILAQIVGSIRNFDFLLANGKFVTAKA